MERQKKERKKSRPAALVLSRGCRERRRGEKQRLFLTLTTQLLGLRPPLLSLSLHPLRSQSDASLPASPPAGTSLPTSVVEWKSSTAWLHLTSARRSRILSRLFPFPLSSRTSAHRIFCWAFYLWLSSPSLPLEKNAIINAMVNKPTVSQVGDWFSQLKRGNLHVVATEMLC